MEAWVEKGKITEIFEFQSPEGLIDPPGIPSPITYRLTGFNWFSKLRPKNKEDIFNK